MDSLLDPSLKSTTLPTLLEKLKLYAEHSPDKLALSFLKDTRSSFGGSLERQITYSELEKETNNLSQYLRNVKDIKAGERVVLVYLPSLDFTIAFISCLKAGIIAVPVFPPHPSRIDTLVMFSRIVDSSGATHALTSSSYYNLKKLSGVKDAFSRLKNRSASSSWPENLSWIITNNLKYAGHLATSVGSIKQDESNTPSTNRYHDLAFLQYTSGSTSEPKGVMITIKNLSHNLTIITNELKAKEDTIVASWLPQYHDMGLIGSYLGIIYCGGSGYYMSPLTFLQRPELWIEVISKYKATHIQAPNFAYKLTARKFIPNKHKYQYKNRVNKSNVSNDNNMVIDLSSIRHMINAAEPVDVTSINMFLDTFEPYGLNKETMYPTYGLAEHTVFVCSGGTQTLIICKKDLEVDGNVVIVSDIKKNVETSTICGCGYPSKQNVEVRIVDQTSLLEIGEDKVGEIWVKSPSKAAGYFNREEETAINFNAKLKSNDQVTDGYLRTGDLGFFHDKELFICGRLKDLIIVGGRNYYPQDIESTAEEVSNNLRPGCSAAFAVEHLGQGEEKVALVMELREVPKTHEMNDICEDLIQQILASVKQRHSISLSFIVLLRPKTVPKTTSGKIARAWCRKAFSGKKLDVIFMKSFEEKSIDITVDNSNSNAGNIQPMEIEQPSAPASSSMDGYTADEIRSLDLITIQDKLLTDIGALASIPPQTIDKSAPLVAMMDSLTLSQFKGMLEHQYKTKLSDEYLFHDTTSVSKLVEVVKLGYAKDDLTEEGNNGSTDSSVYIPGRNTGLAGKLGCPPGVRCIVM